MDEQYRAALKNARGTLEVVGSSDWAEGAAKITYTPVGCNVSDSLEVAQGAKIASYRGRKLEEDIGLVERFTRFWDEYVNGIPPKDRAVEFTETVRFQAYDIARDGISDGEFQTALNRLADARADFTKGRPDPNEKCR
jgi:hypothetical protein